MKEIEEEFQESEMFFSSLINIANVRIEIHFTSIDKMPYVMHSSRTISTSSGKFLTSCLNGVFLTKGCLPRGALSVGLIRLRHSEFSSKIRIISFPFVL